MVGNSRDSDFISADKLMLVRKLGLMARVKIEDIIDHLDTEIRAALNEAVLEVIPDSIFDKYELFRQFKNKVYNKCSTWETVPDHYVEI